MTTQPNSALPLPQARLPSLPPCPSSLPLLLVVHRSHKLPMDVLELPQNPAPACAPPTPVVVHVFGDNGFVWDALGAQYTCV